jgi:hypothetical protein
LSVREIRSGQRRCLGKPPRDLGGKDGEQYGEPALGATEIGAGENDAGANDADADLASPTDGEQESGICIYPPGPRLGRLREKAREKDYQNGVRTISGIPGTLG